jgi:multidrug efflux system outer membrane protein
VSGLSSYFEVLDAMLELYPAEYRLAQTLRDEHLALVEIYRALGGGWSTYDGEPTIPQPVVP